MSERKWVFQPVVKLTLEQMSWLLAWDAFAEERELTDLTWEEIDSRIHAALVDWTEFDSARDVIGHIPSIQRLDLMEWAALQIQHADRTPDLG